VIVGTEQGPVWLRSLDIGSLRLTERLVHANPPTRKDLATLTSAVANAFEDLTPPLQISALAIGGTAQTLRRMVGRAGGSASIS
jgi:exopolyphosphatase / guanosine-5'-triphosphate,3'-diphosphate pyrophosphatase